MIDESFRSYSHFLQVLVCIGAFLTVLLRDEQSGEGKEHKE
jgi:hypothetical protein